MNPIDKTYNPPGRDKLSFRAGTYAGFLQWMESLVKQPVLSDPEGEFPNPLTNLELDGQNDLAAGLFKCWAVIGDILTFYQERIANEGYIGTAIEKKSVIQLVRAIGYRFKPALAAGAYLTFTAAPIHKENKPVIVPKGFSVQALPEQEKLLKGKLPVTFETAEDIQIRPQWNDLTPYLPSRVHLPPVRKDQPHIDLHEAHPVLTPGRLVLITGTSKEKADPKEPPLVFLRTIKAVKTIEEPAPGPSKGRPKIVKTRVRLEPEPLPGSTPFPDRLFQPALFLFKQRGNLFGHNAAQWSTLPLKKKLEAGTPKGGLYVSSDRGSNWLPASRDLPQDPIRAIAIDRGGNIAVGTPKGVYISTDNGETWGRKIAGLSKRDVYALSFDPAGHLFAGCGRGGSYRSTTLGESWEPIQDGLAVDKEHHVHRHYKALNTRPPNTAVRALATYTDSEKGDLYVLAGTDTGILRSVNLENVWEPASDGLPGWNEDAGTAHTVVYAFAQFPEGTPLFAGTDQGLFRSKNHGKSWKKMHKGLDAQHIFGLAACEIPDHHKHLFFFADNPSHVLFAATEKGIYRSVDTGESWHPVKGIPAPGEKGGPVHALAIHVNRDRTKVRLYAATPKGVLASDQLGESWNFENNRLSSFDIRAMAVSPTGILAVAVPFQGVTEKEWPEFELQKDHVDLLQAQQGIVPGSWLAIAQDKPEPLVRVCRVKSLAQFNKTGFLRKARVTRVTLENCGALDHFDRREAVVYCQSQPLPLFRESIPNKPYITGSELFLQGKIPELPGGRLIAVSGKEHVTGPGEQTGERPVVTEIRTLLGEPESVPAEGTGELVTKLALDRPLDKNYEPGTVTISANVIYAGQGETVGHEILGSGNAAKGNQRFTLKKPPLTYVSADTPGGAKSSLKVRVTSGPPHGFLEMLKPGAMEERGIPWHEKETLYGASPTEHAFMTHGDEHHKTHVLFGGGREGSRLPTGIENISATYRSGAGADGNVAAHQLQILKGHVHGLRRVTNPLPAIGGRDPETLDQAVKNAPPSIRTLKRIVSIDDYTDFTRSFAGIAKARVTQLQTPGGAVLHITAAPHGGGPLEESSKLYQDLQAAIIANRDRPVPFRIDSYRDLTFKLGARVILDPQSEAAQNPGAAKALVRQRLLDAFSFPNRQLGQDVGISGIVVAIQQVKGVPAAHVLQLYLAGSTPHCAALLEAGEARWDPAAGRIVPARLLTVDTGPGGILIETGDNHVR